jgi:hypothetical protein
MFAASKPLAITIDGAALMAGKSAGELSFSRVSGAWQAGRFAARSGAKRSGSEGPAAEAVSGRHIYVYGTEGNPSAEELMRRRKDALAAADWTSPRSRLSLNLRVLPDSEVRDSDLAGASLVLFGTKETNRMIRKLAPQLPMELHAGAADYGLVFVSPAGANLVLVNSGLPWWTGAEYAGRQGSRFAGAPYRVLMSFGDYILFKGSLENVVAEGRFDAGWRLPAGDAAKIKASGAVEVKSR